MPAGVSGCFNVIFDLPDGTGGKEDWEFTTQNAGINTSINSRPNPATGEVGSVCPENQRVSSVVNAGIRAIRHIVTYDPGSGSMPTADRTQYVDRPSETVSALPASPTLACNDFAGWFDSAEQPFDENSVVDSNITVHAKWLKRAYTITYHKGSGEGISEEPPTPETVECGANFEENTSGGTLKRVGYTFGGWTQTPSRGAGIDSALITNVQNDINLYPIWNPIDYTFVFKLFDGDQSVSGVHEGDALDLDQLIGPNAPEDYRLYGYALCSDLEAKLFGMNVTLTQSFIEQIFGDETSVDICPLYAKCGGRNPLADYFINVVDAQGGLDEALSALISMEISNFQCMMNQTDASDLASRVDSLAEIRNQMNVLEQGSSAIIDNALSMLGIINACDA